MCLWGLDFFFLLFSSYFELNDTKNIQIKKKLNENIEKKNSTKFIVDVVKSKQKKSGF